jgi:hypothetical protein
VLAPVGERALQMRVDRSAFVSVSALRRVPQDRRRHAREGRLAPLSWGSGGGGGGVIAIFVVLLVLLVLPRLFDPRHRFILLLLHGGSGCEDESDVLFLAELEQQLVRVGIVARPPRLLDPLDRAGTVPLPDLGKDLVQLFQAREQFRSESGGLRGVRFGEKGRERVERADAGEVDRDGLVQGGDRFRVAERESLCLVLFSGGWLGVCATPEEKRFFERSCGGGCGCRGRRRRRRREQGRRGCAVFLNGRCVSVRAGF